MSASRAERRRLLPARVTIAAGTWSLGLVIAALLLPAFDDQTVTGANGITLRNATFVQVNGAWVLIPVLLPLLACAVVGLAVRERHRGDVEWANTVAWLAVAVLAVETVLAIGSIGAFILPVLALLAFGLRLDKRAERQEPRARVRA
jgi:hypothetical protein